MAKRNKDRSRKPGAQGGSRRVSRGFGSVEQTADPRPARLALAQALGWFDPPRPTSELVNAGRRHQVFAAGQTLPSAAIAKRKIVSNPVHKPPIGGYSVANSSKPNALAAAWRAKKDTKLSSKMEPVSQSPSEARDQKTCKARPDNSSSSRGSGPRRNFIPWCG